MVDPIVNRTGLKTRVIYLVAALPIASTAQGSILSVSDSDAAPNVGFNKIVVGGGTYAARVRSDGTNWRLHF